MSIEGLGRKFQEARKARNLSLEEAARLTRIRQSRLAEIEADDFSNFPSLAYAKGFLQIYGKFLEVDVSPYLDAFETSGHLTVDGYSYLQDALAPKAPRTAVTRRTENTRPSLLPFLIGIAILVAGFSFLRFISKLNQIAPHSPDEVAAAQADNEAIDAEGPNRIDIKPLKRTYMQVTIDDDPTKPAFERWVSPSDGTVEFRGHRFSVRVLDREAVQIRKNGKIVSNGDTDLQITAQ